MIDPKDNPPAFPTGPQNQAHGMTLLDYFAAKAMQGLCSIKFKADFKLIGITDAWDLHAVSITETSYNIAQAMLAERKKRLGEK